MIQASDPFETYNFIPQKDALLDSLYRPLPPYLRINTLKTSEQEAFEIIQKEGIELTPIPNVPFFYRAAWEKGLGHALSYKMGLFYPQALSSALPVLALGPRPKDLILDMCAAPGGKTTYMAQLTGDSSLIVANDRNIGRLTSLTSNIKRLGITCVVVSSISGEQFPPQERFHKVLLDAPCSGEGKYRLDREGRVLFRAEGHTNLPAIQKGLIVRAFDTLVPGGTLVYSTCTLNPMENEDVVTYLLKKRPAKVVPWSPPLKSHPGLLEFNGRAFSKEVRHARRFYPHEIDSVGFFVAKIIKPR